MEGKTKLPCVYRFRGRVRGEWNYIAALSGIFEGARVKKNVSDVIERAELENAWTEDKETFQKG